MLSLRRPSFGATQPQAYTPTSPALPLALARAFDVQCEQPSADGETLLRDITTALVQRLKDDGLPPERVVVAVKAAIGRYSVQSGLPSLWTDTEEERPCHGVYKHVFGWLLDAYYPPKPQ